MKYEIMFIVRPNLEEASVKEVAKNFEKILTDNEKEIIRNIPNYNKTKFRKIMGSAKIG